MHTHDTHVMIAAGIRHRRRKPAVKPGPHPVIEGLVLESGTEEEPTCPVCGLTRTHDHIKCYKPVCFLEDEL